MCAKGDASEEVGIRSNLVRMSEEASEAELLALVKQLNEDPAVHGILVQLPLPAHMDPNKVIATISSRVRTSTPLPRSIWETFWLDWRK